MSKKKIVILIIVLIVLAGLIYFFWPKKISGWNYDKQEWYLYDCFGIMDNKYPIKGGSAICYGILHNKQYAENPSQFIQ